MTGDLPPSKSLPPISPFLYHRKRTTYSRRSSVDPFFSVASFNNATVEGPRKARHSMPALPSNSSALQLSFSGTDWEHPLQQSPHRPTDNENSSANFSSVSLDPPINRKVLSELDIQRLQNDVTFRHDLNFDPSIEFRVDTQSPQAEGRRERQREYWYALQAEIAWWLAHYQKSPGDHPNRPLCNSSSRAGVEDFPRIELLRLPRLFGAIQEILKHLLPSEEWPIIQAALDVRLLMQQLEHGVCHFVALGDWLSNYLRRFSSPTRDSMLDTMTSAIRLGVENAKPDSLLYGLVTALEVLQGMSLDATNHCLKNLRLAWVEDTIVYEQSVFLRHMAYGWNVLGAQIWFRDLQEAQEEPRSGMWILSKALTNAVVFFHQKFPPTFNFDLKRLRILQFDFQVLVYQAACRRALTQILRVLGWTAKIVTRSYDDLFFKVAVLLSDQELQYSHWQMTESIALEIVRAAYAICSIHKLPQPEDLDFAADFLRRCCDPAGSIFGVLRGSLAMEVAVKIDEEVCAMGHRTPGQLMKRLVPRQRHFSVQTELEGLVHIAKRIAHIAELHWRIWGPILYERPVPDERPMHVNGVVAGNASPEEEDPVRGESSRSRRINKPGE